jgi:tetratricopeptide (TPR) repeat protein
MTERSDQPKNEEKRPPGPPELTPPDVSDAQEHQASRTRLLLVLGFGLLLVLAAVVVLMLPVSQEVTPQTQKELPVQSPVPQLSPLEQAAEAESRQEVTRLLGVWLRTQAAGEAENVAGWGPKVYAAAVSRAQECDRFLVEQKFLEATAACEEAINSLEGLLAEKETLLVEALDAGDLALAAGDVNLAVDHFQQALAIAPDHEQATAGLRRAERLPEVLELMATGLSLEQAGDVPGAEQSYAAAATLDPDYLPAHESLVRVQGAISGQKFRQAMSRALQALERGDLTTAGQALQTARALKPNDPALSDLQLQLSRARLTGKLARLQQQAESLEKRERWGEALEVCKQALALDSHAAFAVSCQDRVSPRIALDQRLKAILNNPDRLYTDGPLQEARKVLAHASQLAPDGPRLTSQVDQLAQLIRLAETEVEVLIQSDGLTEVVIFHVGRLGPFLEKKLTLRTGNYTATGSRNGYRDVRQTLQVRPGLGVMVFSLRCEEPI